MNIPKNSYLEAGNLYKSILVANIILLLGQTFVAILDSQGKIHITNSFQFLYNCIYWIGTIFVVMLGLQLKGVGIIAIISALIWIILLAATTFKTWGKISYLGLTSSFSLTLKKQLSHGIKIFSAGLLSMFIEPLSKILTGNLIGIKEVGYLEIAYKLRTQVWGLIMKSVYPIFPIISAEKSAINSSKLIVGTQRNLALFILPCAFIIIYTFPFLLKMWLGSSITNELIETIVLIVIAYLVSSVAVPSYFAQLAFLPASIIYGHIANLLINVLISLSLYNLIGYRAIVWGNSFGIIFALIINVYVINVKTIKQLFSLRTAVKYLGIILVLTITNQGIVKIMPLTGFLAVVIFTIMQFSLCLALYSSVEFLSVKKIRIHTIKFFH